MNDKISIRETIQQQQQQQQVKFNMCKSQQQQQQQHCYSNTNPIDKRVSKPPFKRMNEKRTHFSHCVLHPYFTEGV